MWLGILAGAGLFAYSYDKHHSLISSLVIGVCEIVFCWAIGKLFERRKLTNTSSDLYDEYLLESNQRLTTSAAIEEEKVEGIEKAEPKISKKQFYSILNLSREIRKIIVRLSRNHDLFDKINESSTNGGSGALQESYFKSFDKLLLLIASGDLRHCIEEMGHPYDATTATPEGQALCIVANNIQETDFVGRTHHVFFSNLADENRALFSLLKESFDAINVSDFGLSIKSDTLGIAALAGLIDDHDTAERYCVCFYRLASIIAKLDGKVTEKEEKFLKKLLALSGNEAPEGKNSGGTAAADNPEEALNALIGLESVKTEVRNISNFITIRNKRLKAGLPLPPVSYHTVFTGNPGTGKTTVARILAGIFKEKGVLKKGHLVETDRSGLVAEWVGQTAVKTNKVVDRAIDGVLFIDEAYALLGTTNDFGPEAIATLLKRMEDDRDRLIVIIAGYTDEINEFIKTNPGLKSGFTRYINFPDYSETELYDIFMATANKNKYILTDEAISTLKNVISEETKSTSKDKGNARFIRNLFEKVITQQANRLAAIPDIDEQLLSTIEVDDINNALK